MPSYEPQPGLAAAIKRLREAGDLTQRQIADRGHLHLTYVSQMETGEINPGLGTLKKLAQGLGVTLAELGAVIEEMDAGALAEESD